MFHMDLLTIIAWIERDTGDKSLDIERLGIAGLDLPPTFRAAWKAVGGSRRLLRTK
jgi:hypothetical protein